MVAGLKSCMISRQYLLSLERAQYDGWCLENNCELFKSQKMYEQDTISSFKSGEKAEF